MTHEKVCEATGNLYGNILNIRIYNNREIPKNVESLGW